VSYLAEIIKETWLWIIVIGVILVIALPLAIVWFILNLPPPLAFAATIIILVGWGIAAGYKDWIISKRREEKRKQA
jgi:membrane protein YdbS with pleckstrin-like domain